MSTLMPLVNMGVTTMKMISSTNITSTIGTTFGVEMGGGITLLAIVASCGDASCRAGPRRAPPPSGLNSPDSTLYLLTRCERFRK